MSFIATRDYDEGGIDCMSSRRNGRLSEIPGIFNERFRGLSLFLREKAAGFAETELTTRPDMIE